MNYAYIWFVVLLCVCVAGLATKVFLVASLRPYRDEYVARRIVWYPISSAVRLAAFIFMLLANIIWRPSPAVWLAVLACAEIPPLLCAVYLSGVFARWWNGMSKH